MNDNHMFLMLTGIMSPEEVRRTWAVFTHVEAPVHCYGGAGPKHVA